MAVSGLGIYYSARARLEARRNKREIIADHKQNVDNGQHQQTWVHSRLIPVCSTHLLSSPDKPLESIS